MGREGKERWEGGGGMERWEGGGGMERLEGGGVMERWDEEGGVMERWEEEGRKMKLLMGWSSPHVSDQRQRLNPALEAQRQGTSGSP